jgi:hypothetical protein
MYPNLPTSLFEQARERQMELEKVAANYRLLRQIKEEPGRLSILRRAILSTGNLLIVGGTWLKQRAQLEAACTDLQPVSGRVSH